jgi:two-component system, chemotaxis family, CheB/CheR fusion protein
MGSDNFLMVGIGASAGGIRALKQFFERVPAETGIAYVVILHLPPEYDSQLAQVLQVSASIPVTTVQQRVAIEPNHVYVIPPDRTLTIADRHLVISEVTSFEERRAPVDIFFRTLAESEQANAIAVVLSGTGANGSMGVKRVKECGGICLVQNPDEAEYSDMPLHSIATGLVDEILPVAAIPAKILAYRDNRNRIVVAEPSEAEPMSDEHALREILSKLRARTGHDFSSYKRGTVLRRIDRRMAIRQLPDLQAYAHGIEEFPDEASALLKDLLISVTNFFRDREAFERLEVAIVPRLFEGKRTQDHVRAWVAGCATGEEAYSIAMLLMEHATGMPGSPAIQVFASDIDRPALAVARDGVYTSAAVADVSPERLRRFFTREGDVYRIQESLRQVVLFAHHDLLKDPPFAHLDLVSCRNLLIYLNRIAQRRALEVMHFALNAGAFLFLGSAESIEGSSDLFATMDKQAHLFQSRAIATRLPMPIPEVGIPQFSDALMNADRIAEHAAREKLSWPAIHQRLLEAYAPPSLVVNEDYDIVHLTAGAGVYLQFAGGEPSTNLFRVARPELRVELRTALYDAVQQRRRVETGPVALSIDNEKRIVAIDVRPVLRDDPAAKGLILVLFRELDGADTAAAAETVVPRPTEDAALQQLEADAQRLRVQLRTSLERHEAQAEELKASNEELQASNEELRSSTEELETSKEELQSVNEELRTVNQELKNRVEEQAHAAKDIQNLMNSTEIATIFLDRNSRIKLFTPRARDIFTLIPSDSGRPLSDISTALVDADLNGVIQEVMERLGRVENEVKRRDGRWELMRVLPYRTANDHIDGVVLTFLDITARKHSEEQLRRSERRFRLIVEGITDYAIFTMNPAGEIDSWNPGATRVFGYTQSEAIGRSAAMLFTPEDREAGTPEGELRQASAAGRASDERWHVRKDASRFFASGMVASLHDESGALTGFVKIARDLTDRKHWEESLQAARAELETRVEQRTAELSAANAALDAELQVRREAEERIRGLMRRLINVQEDERKRIALDLHDHLGQQVSGIGLKLDALAAFSAADDVLRAAVADARQTVAALDKDLDFFTWELRPAALDHLGIGAALREFVGDWSKEFGIPVDIHTDEFEDVRLSRDVGISLYRITQEALNNIYKHAHATRVGVILERRGANAVLVIEDDGTGFEPQSVEEADRSTGGMGLVSMSERAASVNGTFQIESSAGKGTTIFVAVPHVDDSLV